ncbi:MAG: hypothetical protein DRI69_03865 [Bacteroidetes bacterium]|nr:MAG: hypothetical protein DRI69_03865 [Bacteroidota bacterium]
MKNTDVKLKSSFLYGLPFYILMSFLIYGCGEPASDSNDTTNENAEPQVETEVVTPKADLQNVENDVLPFTLEFEEQSYSGKLPLPHIQSYVSTVSKDGYILAIGGRRQGLHTFEPAPVDNFIADSSNNYIYVIDPKSGDFWSFDVNQLSTDFSAPLQSANQQSYHDRSSDQMYVAGGYGWKADKSDMLTFNTIIGFQVEALVTAVKSGSSVSDIAALLTVAQDDRFAITGGELFILNSTFYLVFGQNFTGQYRAFGGTDFQQVYPEEIRIFTLNPNTLEILTYGANTSTDTDSPFHRRDGNIIEGIDPASGKARISAFGGVFPPGIIGAYTYPIYINSPAAPTIDRSVNQKFSQYECPIISVFDSDSSNPTIYHTFFGGIGHYYYFQTESQHAIYDTATLQGRNDGLPFLADITTFLQTADGSYKEYIHTSPIPGNRLLGTSIRFMVNPDIISDGTAYENGVVKLTSVSDGSRVLVGYIYGGIEAVNPLPEIPNTGTSVSNSLFAVYLTTTPSDAMPASEGHNSGENNE